MSEKREVPAFYPDFANADKWKEWDGSPEAEAWARVQVARDRALVESAAFLLKAGGPGTDLGGLAAALWHMTDEEIITVLHYRQEEITRWAGDGE